MLWSALFPNLADVETSSTARVNMITKRRRVWFILILILTVIAIYASIALYWQRHLDIKLGPRTERHQAQLAQIDDNLERTVNGMKKGEIPWRKADYKSIGFPEKE